MISSTHFVRYIFDFSRRPSRSISGRSRNSESTSRKELWCLFWAADSQRLLCAMRAAIAVQRTFGLLSLGVLLPVGSLGVSAGLVLVTLVGQGVLQHPDVLVELVVELLRAAHLALLLRDLGLHLGPLNVPGIAGAFVVVPFELQEAHNPCGLVSRAASSNMACVVATDGALPCSVYSVPAGALPSPPPLTPPAFMADGDCHAMAVLLCGGMPVSWLQVNRGDGACDVCDRRNAGCRASKLHRPQH